MLRRAPLKLFGVGERESRCRVLGQAETCIWSKLHFDRRVALASKAHPGAECGAPASATPGAYANGVTAVPGISTRESWQAPYQPRCPCRSGTETGHLRTQPSLSLSKGLDWQLAILLEHCIMEKE